MELYVCYICVGSPFLNVLSSQRLYIFLYNGAIRRYRYNQINKLR